MKKIIYTFELIKAEQRLVQWSPLTVINILCLDGDVSAQAEARENTVMSSYFVSTSLLSTDRCWLASALALSCHCYSIYAALPRLKCQHTPSTVTPLKKSSERLLWLIFFWTLLKSLKSALLFTFFLPDWK